MTGNASHPPTEVSKQGSPPTSAGARPVLFPKFSGVPSGRSEIISIPTTLNLIWAAAHGFVFAYQFFILPALLLPRSSRWTWTLLPLALLNNPLWSLMHEAVHGSLHPVRLINQFLGRLLGIFFAGPFRVLRVGHLLHHKYNRTPVERQETFDPRTTSYYRAALRYYVQLFGGTYLSVMCFPFLSFLPKRSLRALTCQFLNKETFFGRVADILLRDESLREIRRDGFLILLWMTLSAILYGAHWPILAGILAFRCFSYSFLDYLYHYASPLDNVPHAYNLCLPKPLSWLLLYFNYHAVHHADPTLPWIHLPKAFLKQEGIFHAHYWRAALHQLQGPLPLDQLPKAASLRPIPQEAAR